MGTYKEITGDLIQLSFSGIFDCIAHSVNCFCIQYGGIALQMSKVFKTNQYSLEHKDFRGDINKLGCIEWNYHYINGDFDKVAVINLYSQYDLGKDLYHTSNIAVDYDALTLCLRKLNFEFKGKKIGLPQLSCGLAGGSWDKIKEIIQRELFLCDVTIVIFDKF